MVARPLFCAAVEGPSPDSNPTQVGSDLQKAGRVLRALTQVLKKNKGAPGESETGNSTPVQVDKPSTGVWGLGKALPYVAERPHARGCLSQHIF